MDITARTRNPLGAQAPRGFESHLLRHTVKPGDTPVNSVCYPERQSAIASYVLGIVMPIISNLLKNVSEEKAITRCYSLGSSAEI